MRINLHAKLGGNYLNDDDLRMKALKSENDNYLRIKNNLFNLEKDKIDKYVVLYIKGYGNSPELLNSFKTLLFNSRELLDSTLFRLNSLTKDKKHQTSKDFSTFIKQLSNNMYECSRILNFFKINITFLFHIRKVRNIIKTNPSMIEFRMVTNHLEAHLVIPLSEDELYLVPLLDVKGKDKILENESYHATFILDKYYPETIEFWRTVEEVFKSPQVVKR